MTRSTSTRSKAALALLLLGLVAGPAVADGIDNNPLGGQLPGTQTNDNAATGNVGEYLSQEVALGSSVALTTSVAANIATITLPPGDWNVWGQCNTNPNAATVTTLVECQVSSTSATRATPPNGGAYVFDQQSRSAGTSVSNSLAPKRISVSTSTQVWMVMFTQFNTNTLAGYGGIYARRVR